MEADQLHPLPGDGPVATADERGNMAGLDNVMNVLEMSPLVKNLPARRMSSSTTSSETKGEPDRHVACAIRWSGQCHVTALPLNLAGLTEDRMNVWCPGSLMTLFRLTRFLKNSIVCFASVHMNEPVSLTPAIPPSRA